jgi:hypothetical protein
VALSLFYVGGPLSVTAHGVDTQPDNLAVSLRELRLQPGHVAEFGGANGSKVFRVRKQDCPAIADPLVEGYGAFGGLRSKIGGYVIYAQAHIRREPRDLVIYGQAQSYLWPIFD